MGPHPRQVFCIGTHQWVLVIVGGRTGTCNVCKPNSNNQWLCANGFRPADQFKETSSASSKSQCCFHCFVPKHVKNPESGKIRPSQHQTVCCPSVMSSELQWMRKLYIQQAWEFFIVSTIPLWFPCKHSKSNGFWCFILLNKRYHNTGEMTTEKYLQTGKQQSREWGVEAKTKIRLTKVFFVSGLKYGCSKMWTFVAIKSCLFDWTLPARSSWY